MSWIYIIAHVVILWSCNTLLEKKLFQYRLQVFKKRKTTKKISYTKIGYWIFTKEILLLQGIKATCVNIKIIEKQPISVMFVRKTKKSVRKDLTFYFCHMTLSENNFLLWKFIVVEVLLGYKGEFQIWKYFKNVHFNVNM